MNIILLERGNFKQDRSDIMLASMFVVCEEAIKIEHRNRVLEQVNSFKVISQSRSSDEK